MTPQQGLFIFSPSDSLHGSIPGQQCRRGWGSLSPQGLEGLSPGDAHRCCQPPRQLSFPNSQTADGKQVVRGYPQAWGPAGLPAYNFIFRHLSRRQGSPGGCSGASIPRGLSAGGFSLPLLPWGPRLGGSSRTRQAHSSDSYSVQSTRSFNFFFPFKEKTKKSHGGRMKRNADNNHPPNFLQSPKPEERRPPFTAAGEGSCPRPPPAPRSEPRNAGRRQREPEYDTASEQPPPPPARAGAPTAPLRPGDLPSLPSLPSQPPPAAPAAGSVTGHRNAAAPGTPAGAPHTLCQTKTRPGPLLLLLSGATRLARPGTPGTPAGPKASFLAQSWGCNGAAPPTCVHSPRGRELFPVLFPTPSELEGRRAAERRPGRG